MVKLRSWVPITLFLVALLEFTLTTRNVTHSMPVGWYIKTFSEPTRGTIVRFPLPEAIRPAMYQYGVLDWFDVHHDQLLKPVVGIPGDIVCRNNANQFSINGKILGTAVIDGILPEWNGCSMIAKNKLAVFSDYDKHSVDSRYFGLIDKESAVSYAPLFTW